MWVDFGRKPLTTTIDVIDDDEAVRDSTRALLETCGYKVREHASAESYLSHLSANTDCLVVDQQMPGMSGLDLVTLLRLRGDRTPAVIVTGRVDSTVGARAGRIGVKLFYKPLTESQLVNCVEEACRHPS